MIYQIRLSDVMTAILQTNAELQNRGVLTISNQISALLGDGFITLL
jgi:hypothetical protein